MPTRRILLVEDQPDDQFLTLRTLKKLNINNVAVANEGDEALRYLQKRLDSSTCETALPSLIILDLRMPKFDGFEFLESIRSDHRTREIPVVVLSSSRQERETARCRELGVKACLVKPLEPVEFGRALRSLRFTLISWNQPYSILQDDF